MVQREVAERLSAKVSTKFYSRTSVLVQLHSDVRKVFDVSPDNFHPKPKVNSSVIELSPKSNLDFNYENIRWTS
jgi:16S rRNA (adenine1518-N6/adenine1519-N6)-dimethyltransferase